MNEQQDPYETLNLPRNATQAQIKSAYRKLALKYHPDKQQNEEDKRKCSETFTFISNAYEILGDPERRQEFDRFGTAGPTPSPGGTAGHHEHPFGGGFFNGGHPFMNDPFFSGGFGGRREGNQQSGGFMDPFEVFRNAFGNDFGFENHFENHRQNDNMHGGVDPYGGMMGNHMHMHMMNTMMNNMQPSFPNMNQAGGNSHFSSYSSSSSSFGGSGGTRESVSTSTRVINGKRQTITERTIVKPDGTVERTTETSGDDNFLSNGGDGQYLQD